MIKEIDYNKYIVIKTNDLQYLNIDEQKHFADALRKISMLRAEKENKFGLNKYLVLNIDDDFNPEYLISLLQNRFKKLGKDEYYNLAVVKSMAIDLINSIIKG